MTLKTLEVKCYQTGPGTVKRVLLKYSEYQEAPLLQGVYRLFELLSVLLTVILVEDEYCW